MRLMLKVAGAVVLGVAALAVCGYAYLLLAYPRVGKAADLRVQPTPARVARGKYLADHVAVCTDCHSQRDWTRYAAPIKPETYGAGGETWDETIGFPGRLVARNITPAGLASWSDGEIARAITEGVSRDGAPLFPLMPYPTYGRHLARDDVEALVAYMRTIPPRTTPIADRRLHFPLPLIVRTMPAAATAPATPPDQSDRTAYGGYLTEIAGCVECHTPVDDRRTPVPGLRLAGGQEFLLPNGLIARSANLTPDGSGIGGWSEAQFVEKFKAYADPAALVPTATGAFNTPMPWPAYAGMTREDLGAIFRYLQTVPATAHRVEKVGR